MLHINMDVEIKEYIDKNGKSPFEAWFASFDDQIAAKISLALVKITKGNISNIKSTGDGILEYRLHFGAGIRIYFGKDSNILFILLGGGTKRRQEKDIKAAKDRWQEYKERKKKGNTENGTYKRF